MPFTRTRNHHRRVGRLLTLTLALACLAPRAAGANDATTRATMGEIFDAMQPLLLRALDPEDFGAEAQRAEIDAAFELLARSSSKLASHGRRHGPGFAYLGGLLADDAADARVRWHEADTEAARFLVLQMTETCIACHSRLPSQDTRLSERFVAEESIQALPLRQRALVQYATRRFDSALDSYEAMLQSEELTPSELDLMGHLDEYVELAVRVRNANVRAAKALERFAGRSDIHPVLEGEVSHWVSALRAQDAGGSSGLDRAEALVRAAEAGAPERTHRDSLVEYTRASAQAHQVLDGGIDDASKRARALYLLGLVDTRIGRSFWLSQAESYLEAAIREVPGTPLAADAYALLEEYLIAGFTGSAGENVPADVAAHLADLRQLARPAPASDG